MNTLIKTKLLVVGALLALTPSLTAFAMEPMPKPTPVPPPQQQQCDPDQQDCQQQQCDPNQVDCPQACEYTWDDDCWW